VAMKDQRFLARLNRTGDPAIEPREHPIILGLCSKTPTTRAIVASRHRRLCYLGEITLLEVLSPACPGSLFYNFAAPEAKAC
jgi:hypothetical protein